MAKSFSPYYYGKTYQLAKIGNEVLVILKRRDVSDYGTKSGSWRKYVWLTLSVLKIQTTYYNKASSNDTENFTEFLF